MFTNQIVFHRNFLGMAWQWQIGKARTICGKRDFSFWSLFQKFFSIIKRDQIFVSIKGVFSAQALDLLADVSTKQLRSLINGLNATDRVCFPQEIVHRERVFRYPLWVTAVTIPLRIVCNRARTIDCITTQITGRVKINAAHIARLFVSICN